MISIARFMCFSENKKHTLRRFERLVPNVTVKEEGK